MRRIDECVQLSRRHAIATGTRVREFVIIVFVWTRYALVRHGEANLPEPRRNRRSLNCCTMKSDALDRISMCSFRRCPERFQPEVNGVMRFGSNSKLRTLTTIDIEKAPVEPNILADESPTAHNH